MYYSHHENLILHYCLLFRPLHINPPSISVFSRASRTTCSRNLFQSQQFFLHCIRYRVLSRVRTFSSIATALKHAGILAHIFLLSLTLFYSQILSVFSPFMTSVFELILAYHLLSKLFIQQAFTCKLSNCGLLLIPDVEGSFCNFRGRPLPIVTSYELCIDANHCL